MRTLAKAALGLAIAFGCSEPQPPLAPGSPETLSPAPATPEISAVEPAAASPEAEPEPEVPIAVAVYTNRTQYLLGEPVQIFLQIRNCSRRPVVVRSNYALDKALHIFITPAHGQTWRFIDRIRTGLTIPNVTTIPAGESKGFYVTLAHCAIEGHEVPFPTPGLHRLDVRVDAELDDSGRIDTLLAPPVTFEVIEPVRAEDRAVFDIFLQPEVCRAIQEKEPPESLEDMMLQVLELAPDSVYAEHAHVLLAILAMGRQEWLRANEHLYPVYEREGGFYPKDLILTGIMSNFHSAGEPEKALAVCRVLLDLFPNMRDRRDPLIDAYVARFIDAQQAQEARP